MRKKITIAEVAKKAGVTGATVSLVLNGHPRIPAETRKRVLKAVKALDYAPNQAARSLAAGKTNTIAIASISFSAWYEMALMRGIEKEIGGGRYGIIQYPTAGNPAKEKELSAGLLNGGRADGLIGFSFVPPARVLAEMKKRKYPFVSVGEKVRGFCSVVFDDYAGAYAAAERLIKAGRRNIAIINQRRVRGYTASDVRQKLKGFRDAAVNYGIDPSNVIEVENVYFKDGEDACEKIAAMGRKIDGVFCGAGDNTAIGFIKRARKLGISIPSDMALIGYDDIETAGAVTPELTTVRQPVEEAGAAAFRRLADMISGKPAGDIVFNPVIIERESG
ncbi:MAG TPA: LacI family transcriptional regulator [bacterium]|nr:LacI family transcriptional regulator [bacterium]